MITNTSMTLYHKIFNENTRKNEWIRSVIEKQDDETGVMWQGGKGASINEGYENANDVKIFIPKTNDLVGIKFDIGDIVIKGIIERNIIVQQDLADIDNVYNINTIIDYDYGSENMRHIELGGK